MIFKVKTGGILIVLLFLSIDLSAQIGRLALSPRQTIHQVIGITNITVDYSRPAKRERDLFGALIPYGEYWRTGANRNTTVEIDQDFFVNGELVRSGKYALFTIPNPDEWEVLFYTDIDNWDVPADVDTSKIVARTIIPSGRTNKTKERLSIAIGDFTNYEFELIVSWGNTEAILPIQLNTRELMNQKIDKHLSGPDYEDYYLAAVYQMESGHEYDKGLDWINQAMEVTEEIGWWDLRVKSILLMRLGNKEAAKVAAEEGLKMAKTIKRQSAINGFNRILREMED